MPVWKINNNTRITDNKKPSEEGIFWTCIIFLTCSTLYQLTTLKLSLSYFTIYQYKGPSSYDLQNTKTFSTNIQLLCQNIGIFINNASNWLSFIYIIIYKACLYRQSSIYLRTGLLRCDVCQRIMGGRNWSTIKSIRHCQFVQTL